MIKQSIGIIPVTIIGDDYKFLILRSYKHWEFPKGRKNPGESLIETAIREMAEETTISKQNLDFRWGMAHTKIGPYKTSYGQKEIIYFLAFVNKITIVLPFSEEIGKPEHEEYRWVSDTEARKLLNRNFILALEWAKDKITNG